MGRFRKILRHIKTRCADEEFILFLEQIQVVISKVLSLAMVVLIIIACCHLIIYLAKELIFNQTLLLKNTLFELFGLFLNILIALELLENISAYLRKHIIQVELVIVTSLIAVARKIILFDLDKKSAWDLMSLGVALIALSSSYWIIRKTTER
ncbi:MAG: phosphate-starvation-inducible PsiE family protein [Microcoleaceae cyanobacterium]